MAWKRLDTKNIYNHQWLYAKNIHPLKIKKMSACYRYFLVVNVSFLPKVCTLIFYYGNIVTRRNLNLTATMLRTECLVKLQVVLLKPILIIWCDMVYIYTKQKHTWPWNQYFLFHKINMLWLTGNVHFNVAPNVQVLSYWIRSLINITQTCVQQ